MNWIIYFLIILIGMVLGSFFNVCIYRIPRKESIVFPASHCPVCKHKITMFDNIPIFSYLFLKGKCRYCGAKISPIYPIIEIITPLFFLGLFFVSGQNFSPDFWKYFVFISFGIIIFSIDVVHKIIPDVLSLPLLIIGFLFSLIPGSKMGIVSAFTGAAFGFFVFFILAYLFHRFMKKEALGGGDIKLIAAIGSFVGFYGVLFTIFFASFFALIFILVFYKERTKEIPFAPFLISAAVFYVLFGHLIFDLYLRLFLFRSLAL